MLTNSHIISQELVVPATSMDKRLKTKLFAWWYFAIAAGFVLLAINRWLVGEPTWLIVLRFAIALGFSLLGYATWRK